MKVIVKKYLNVRTGTPSVNAPCYNYLAPGSRIEVEANLVVGDSYQDNNLWYKGLDGSYYWSGGVDPVILHESGNKTSFNWFKELAIETIWEKYSERGEKACIAVLDTGFKTDNSELVVPDSDREVFISDLDGEVCNTISDLMGHGTRCASIIGSRNQSQYNIGIAPKSRLLVGKISCYGDFSDPEVMLKAIQWAAGKGADIVSISFGFIFDSPEKQAAYEFRLNQIIQDKKILIFASAGNNFTDTGPMFGEKYPASFDACISVGASNNGAFDNITLQSNKTIIHAPGRHIESFELGTIPLPASGTSFSTPIVAGIAALAVSYLKKKNHGSWDPDLIREKLYSSALPLTGNKKNINPLQFFGDLK
jgi:subtilisin family serine protease